MKKIKKPLIALIIAELILWFLISTMIYLIAPLGMGQYVKVLFSEPVGLFMMFIGWIPGVYVVIYTNYAQEIKDLEYNLELKQQELDIILKNLTSIRRLLDIDKFEEE